jgi:cell wall-associated NlpC family hydrolase
MQNARIAIALASMIFSTGCAAGFSQPQRDLPKNVLISRAWAGREPPTTGRALTAVAFASAQVGKPYCWGGTGEHCFDCSGLVQTAWHTAGEKLPRTTGDIAHSLQEIPADDVRAGDILWWPGHVGIYIGYGWMVDALDHAHGVVRRPAKDPYRAFRPLGE